MNEMIGRCHDCTAPQTEVNMLSRHILELQKDKGELIDKVRELEKRCANYEMTISKMEKGTCDICKETEKDKKIEELEAQIEKMKCCYNCKHSRTEYEHCKTDKSEKWEIKEK